MISHFKVCCRSFVYFLIAAFTICTIPHIELILAEFVCLLNNEAHAAEVCSNRNRTVPEYVYEEKSPKSFETSYTYDYSGKVMDLTHPDGYQVLYEYHPGTALLKKVTGSDGKTYAEITDYSAAEQMTQIEYGNRTATRYGYDPVSLRLNSIVTTDKSRLEANDLQRMSYSYSPTGNVLSITDDLYGIADGYQYDALGRLTKEMGTGGGPWMAHRYDDAGNILTRTLGPTQMAYHYGDTSRRDLLTGITVNGARYSFSYNARGNLVKEPDLTDFDHVGTRTIIYDAEGLPVTVSNTRTGHTVDVEYDGQGMRAAKRVRNGMETLYVFAHYEEKGGIATKYIFANGTRIAKVESERVKYLHPDHLGSTSLVTDETGKKVASQEYMPFGMKRGTENADSETNYQYTGQEYDVETGLHWYGSRYYNPVIGRFITADTIVPDITDIQALNPYSYCLNNPLKYTDPAGHLPKTKKVIDVISPKFIAGITLVIAGIFLTIGLLILLLFVQVIMRDWRKHQVFLRTCIR